MHTHIHDIPSLLCLAVLIYTFVIYFILTLTLTVRLLKLFRRWRESAHHITSIVVVLCGRQDPRGFRACRSGIRKHAGSSCSQRWWRKVMVLVEFVSPATLSHPSSKAVIPNHCRQAQLLCKNRNYDFDSKYKYISATVKVPNNNNSNSNNNSSNN